MAIPSSGAISLTDIRTEFSSGSGAISFSDFYRGGSNVRAKAGNNNATNLAASVPTSGAIGFADFHSTEKGFRYTYSSGATNQDASNLFGDDYGVDYPKSIVINAGVELGATSTGQEALQIDSGLSGGLTITNNGTLSGAGGAANGGTGGDAFEADVSCTFVNNGTVRAGGGGGGAGGSGGTGGTGGQGSTSSTGWGNTEGPYNWQGHAGSGTHNGSVPALLYVQYYDGNWKWFWRNDTNYSGHFQTVGNSTVQYGPHLYTRGNAWANFSGVTLHRISRQSQVTNYTYHSGGSGGGGGSGGAGGVGQGYGQSAGSGSSGSGGSGGSSGGSNAGSGGTGGTGGSGGAGGSFGAGGSGGSTGATGNSGGNGNHTNGSGGSSGSGGSGGGSAGNYIQGLSNVSFTNNGTVQGNTN